MTTTWRSGTPFFERSSRLSTHHRIFEWSSLLLVDVFTTVEAELRAMRTGVSMNDMSPLSKSEVRGPDAARAIDRLVTKDTSRMAVGDVVYTPWCREDGKVVNDGLVFRIAEDAFRISSDPQMVWLSQVTEGLSVELEDVSRDWGILSLQGPRSREVLERATEEDWSGFPFSRRRETQVGGVQVDVSRQGFTGELGYELWVRWHDGAALWDAIAETGAEADIQAAGETAVDVARVEAGLVLISADYAGAGPDHHSVSYVEGHESSPFGLGMGYLVDFDGHDFVGRDALAAELDSGGSRETLVGLELDWGELTQLYHSHDRAPCVRAAPHWLPLNVSMDGRTIGRATSVTWSPTTGKLIGFGVLDGAVATVGSLVKVEWDLDEVAGAISATVRELPFVPRRRAS